MRTNQLNGLKGIDMTDVNDEKDSEVDVLGWGKYSTYTPMQVLQVNPKYLIWAWENTAFWVGSKEVIMAAYKKAGQVWKDRTPQITDAEYDEAVGRFEAAMLRTFGCFPIKPWMR